MKKIITFALLLLAGVAFNPALADDDDAKKGIFKFETETYNFGKVKKDIPVTHVFKFVNTGEQPIIIFSAKASCGCTEPSYSSTPVKKGATGEISVTFNAKAVGPFNKMVTVMSNAQSSTKIIYIKGEVVE